MKSLKYFMKNRKVLTDFLRKEKEHSIELSKIIILELNLNPPVLL